FSLPTLSSSLHPPKLHRRLHTSSSSSLATPLTAFAFGKIVAPSALRNSQGENLGFRSREEFPLSASSFLKIQKGDITRWSVDGVSDAIVNPANERMLGGGGANGGIACESRKRTTFNTLPSLLYHVVEREVIIDDDFESFNVDVATSSMEVTPSTPSPPNPACDQIQQQIDKY
ncbi:hypothetical protein V2J09_004001, partial [Rumex salicifolius]